MFSAPIPGQSLTSEPKNSPWENPPEYTAPEDAVLWHIERLNKPEKLKASLNMLELGVDVVTLTEGILRAAVAMGKHSIDVSLIIGPIIHELIKSNADTAGIDYEEGLEEDDMASVQKEIDYSIQERQASKILREIKEDSSDVDLSTLEDSQETPMEDIPEDTPEEKPMGLMSRRSM
tara:strand:+ start:741 stop:1271 length:531 start_codon:yes stop_codon:yes gene_type:complete